jgi:hypothetical protein
VDVLRTTNSAQVFKLQKKVVRIMVGADNRVSCEKNLDHSNTVTALFLHEYITW